MRSIHVLGDNVILGAFFVDELRLLGLWPIRIIPHCHCVFHVDDTSDERMERLGSKLANSIKRHIHARHSCDCLHPTWPSIALKPIREQLVLKRCLEYATKEIDLSFPYNPAETAQGDEWIVQPPINRNLQLFLNGYLTTINNRKMIHSTGTMNPSSSNYIGNRCSNQRRNAHSATKVAGERCKSSTEPATSC